MNPAEIRKIIRDEIRAAVGGEELIPQAQAAKILGISKRAFENHRSALQARGMQVQRCGAKWLVRRRSLDELIRRAAEREEAIFSRIHAEKNVSRRGAEGAEKKSI